MIKIPRQSEAALGAGEATRRQMRGSSLMLAGRLIALGVSFGTQVLLVRFLAKDDYGSFAYVLSLVLLGSSVARLGLDKALSRFVPIYLERRDWAHMTGTIAFVVGVILAWGGCLVLALLALRGVLAEHVISSPLSAALLAMLFLLAPVEALENVLEKLFAIFARPRTLFFRRYILGPLLKLAAVLPLVFFHSNVYVLAGCYLAARLVGTGYSALLMIVIWRRQGHLHRFRWRGLQIPARKLIGFSTPLLATDLAFVLRTSLVTLLLEMLHGPLGVAAFRAVVPVARLNLTVMESFKLLYSPTAARLYAANDREGVNELYWHNLTWIALVTFPVFLVSFSLGRPLAAVLFGAEYSSSGPVLSILALGCYFNAAFGFNALTLRIHGNVRRILVNDLSTAALAVALNLALIPKWGALGGAAATSGSLMAQNLLNQYALTRTGVVRPAPWPYVRAYLGIAAASLGLLVVQSALSPPLYVGLVLAAVLAVLVGLVNLPVLHIERTFPELLRFTPARKLLGRGGRIR